MKSRIHIIVYLIMFSFSHFATSQNLVPNPSFEIYTTCPNGLDELNRCQGWDTFRGTPDYFNTCSTTNGIAPPNCAFGYQWPHSGNGYIGVMTYDSINPNCITTTYCREYAGAQLSSPLIIGQGYYISFFVNLGAGVPLKYILATNKIGVRFSTVPFYFSNPAPLNNSAHFYTNTIITDTISWIQLFGSFIADSAYNYIVLGNFFDDTNTDTLKITSYSPRSYYLIDDVCVSTDSIYASTWTGIYEISSTRNRIKIYPNPVSDFLIIDSGEKIEEVHIVNMFGQIIYYREIKDELNFSFSLLVISTGVYIIKIKTKNIFFNSLINVIH